MKIRKVNVAVFSWIALAIAHHPQGPQSQELESAKAAKAAEEQAAKAAKEAKAAEMEAAKTSRIAEEEAREAKRKATEAATIAKAAVEQSSRVERAKAFLQEAIKKIGPVTSSLTREEDKQRAHDATGQLIREAQTELNSIKRGGPYDDAKLTIQLAVIEVRGSPDHTTGKYNYNSPKTSWDARKVRDLLVKAMKELQPPEVAKTQK